ncbi:hypothetical protein B0H14DRAFT_2775713 [Mycena olivaceomarginata]|nr:hypothetical protein B0H14DRAFT_2775713 [Mycena olivaceomarginata]
MRLSTNSLVLLALWAAKLGRGQQNGNKGGNGDNHGGKGIALSVGSAVTTAGPPLSTDTGSQVKSSATSTSSEYPLRFSQGSSTDVGCSPGFPVRSSLSLSANSSSGFVPSSQRTSIPQSTDSTQATSAPVPVAGPTHIDKSRIHARGIAVIAVALSIFLFCFAAILVWHIRRRRRQRQAAKSSEMRIDRATTTISPFTLITEASTPRSRSATLSEESDVRSISASTIARQRLETQLHAATEKVADLEGRERFDGGDSSGGSGMRRMLRLMSARSASTRLPEVEAQLQAAREQIDMLVTRINALEENSDAGWRRVIGDEPPPEYV